ncbi:hypothetical protein GCM10027570_40970 [Streptomonospora sediminis]
MGTDAYEAPAVTELGEFTDQTGAGIGGQIEDGWPLADRS